MEQLKMIKEQLISAAQGQMGNLKNVDAKELGEVIDMIKDLDEAMYYCTITEAMKKEGKEEKEYKHYYGESPDYRYMNRDRDFQEGRIHYYGNGNSDNNGGGATSYSRSGQSNNGNGGGRRNYEDTYPMEIRDYREGNSPISRRNYMESKELHQGKEMQMQELEHYMQELSTDITDMIMDASSEEKALLQQKLSALANKIK